MKILLEVREYNFQDGTKLLIKLDRREKTASFVYWDDRTKSYEPFEFKFAGRGVNFMNGWHNIMSAMQYVTIEARTAMDEWAKEESDKLIEMMTMLGEADREIRKANEQKAEKGAKK